MRDYWQRRPLLVRQAIEAFRAPLSIDEIRQLVRREEVESRLIWRDRSGWHMKHGPFTRLPAKRRPGWTLLAQSVDLHDDETARLREKFRFIADARLDDIMISIATDGGGVGPHFDSYDVFLLQAVGSRRWRIGAQKDLTLRPGLPLKILRNFQPEREYVLGPGDMLYLPPQVAHDGVASGDCMTISIGFRAPTLAVLARGLLETAGDQITANAGNGAGLYGEPPLPGPVLTRRFTDAGAPPVTAPARLPDALIQAALRAAERVRFNERLAARFLGQWLTELPSAAAFEPDAAAPSLEPDPPAMGRLVLDRCTRMMYRGRELYINGSVAGLPATPPLRTLANARELAFDAPLAARLTAPELHALSAWMADGWLHYDADGVPM